MIDIKANNGVVKASIKGNVETIIKESAAITSALSQAVFQSVEDDDLEFFTDFMLEMTADIIKDASDSRKNKF